MTTKQILASPAIVKRILMDLGAIRVRISRVPSGGLDVRAVSSTFECEDPTRVFNDALATEGFTLPNRSILWLRGPGDMDPEDEALFAPPKAARPTWADALLLEPITPHPPDERGFGQCRSVAFWGLKGGVGRTTALAHIASLLGRRKPVLAVDLDLDAPGLVSTLCDMTATGVERFDELLERAADPSTSEDELTLAVGRAIVPAKDSSSVWVLGPASADVEFVQRLLGPLSPGALYRSNTAPLRRILSIAIRSVSAEYLFIDARSGYCDESAMSVLDLADEVIVFASPAPSTFLSISPAIEALERSRCAIGRPEIVRFVAGMLPAEQTVRQRIVDELLAVAEETRAQISKELATAKDDLPRDVEIQSIEYSSRIVDNEGRLMHGIIDGYMDLAERLSPRAISPGIASVEPTFARQVLSEISIPTPQSEDEVDPAKLEELFTVTGKLREFARHEVSLVLGAKGTGKTFLRRLCLQNPTFVAKRSGMASLASTHFIEAYVGVQTNPGGPCIDADVLKQLDEKRPDWNRLWSAIALIQISAEPAIGTALSVVDSSISKMVRDVRNATSLSKIVAGIRKLASEPDLSSAWRALEFEGVKSNKTLVLVFDQLDVALGSGPSKRSRRKALIEGLLEASSSWRDTRHLGAKIFLREDLWHEIEFEEKAKYATRIVTLTWSEQEIWRLCIRAFSVGSATFRRHLLDRMGIDVDKLEEATEEQQKMALTLIWGERMGGTESDTFSVSWAYRRLHDGQGRLFPRAALWLLVFAIREQKNLGIRDMPPLLSPDALRAAMPHVAANRLEELRAEAPGDWRLIGFLKGFPSYMDEKKFVAQLSKSMSTRLPDAREAMERLQELGVLERGSRRDGTPTVRIVDLYAFAATLEVDRLGRR